MKYLVLAYGDEKHWNALTKNEQDALLAQDEVLRNRGDLVAAVESTVTTLRAWDGIPKTTESTFADSSVPLAGFGIIEAGNLDEVVQLIAGAPCARAKGAIEVRPILGINAANAASEIRALIENMADATRAKNVDALLVHYAPDILAFDVVNPLRYKGLDALRKRATEWFSSFQGPIDYEIRDLNIVAGDAAAFCHSLNHVIGTNTDGRKLDMWWRATLGFHKLNGKWLVTHVHGSVPFEAGSGKASLDLKP